MTETGPNQALIDHLLETAYYYEIVGEEGWAGRKYAYLRAIDAIKPLNWSVLTREDAATLYGIGKGKKIGPEIEEFALTGGTGKLDELKRKAGDSAKYIDLFRTVFGIGPVTAIELYREKHYRSLDDLRANISKLTKAQQLGLKYYTEIRQPVTRAMTLEMKGALDVVARKLNCSVDIVGSFRRGEPTSSDIDVLVVGTDMDTFLRELFRLKKIETLAKGKRKFMGIVPLSPTTPSAFRESISSSSIFGGSSAWRRIDIRVFDREHYPTALLYFTGSAKVNVAMRIRAASITLKLSEYGLYYEDGSRVPVFSEVDVFAALNIVYLSPEQRTRDVQLLYGNAYDNIILTLAATPREEKKVKTKKK